MRILDTPLSDPSILSIHRLPGRSAICDDYIGLDTYNRCVATRVNLRESRLLDFPDECRPRLLRFYV